MLLMLNKCYRFKTGLQTLQFPLQMAIIFCPTYAYIKMSSAYRVQHLGADTVH